MQDVLWKYKSKINRLVNDKNFVDKNKPLIPHDNIFYWDTGTFEPDDESFQYGRRKFRKVQESSVALCNELLSCLRKVQRQSLQLDGFFFDGYHYNIMI